MTNKAFIVDYNLINNADSSELLLYQLSQQDIITIISQLQYLYWKTRWYNAPPNFEQDNFVANIESRLLTPMSFEIDCTDIENCLANSAIIASLSSQVSSNTGDIASLSSQVSSNTGDIASLSSQVSSNTGDIASLSSQVSSNTGDISLNISAIQANKDDISLNISAIQANKDDISLNISAIQANKDDIIALQSIGGSGSDDLVLIHSQVLEFDGNFDVVDVSGYDSFVVIFSVGMGTSAGIYTNLIINGDVNNANYYNSIAGQYPNVARCATPSWVTLGRFTSGKIECYDTRTDGKKREITSSYVSPTIAGSYAYMYNDSMHYRVQAPIDTIELKNNNGNLSAGSSITVLGVPAKVQAIDYDWQVFIDFTDDRNELLDTIVASYQLGNDRYVNSENPLRRLALAWLLSEQIEHVRLVIDAELTDGQATIFTEDETGFQIEQNMEIGRKTYTFETGFTRNGFSTVARDITLPGIVYFYAVTIFGNGTIPAQLAPYEV